MNFTQKYFKQFLYRQNAEYHYYREFNKFQINYDGDYTITKQILKLAKESNFTITLKLPQVISLDVSNNPQLVEEMGFENEVYNLPDYYY